MIAIIATVIYNPYRSHYNVFDRIKNVQRRLTKQLQGLCNYNYCDRLKLCNLKLLELRRVHFDAIIYCTKFEMVYGMYKC